MRRFKMSQLDSITPQELPKKASVSMKGTLHLKHLPDTDAPGEMELTVAAFIFLYSKNWKNQCGAVSLNCVLEHV